MERVFENMRKTPLVSAVIITHNRSELLKKAVESVKRQTYPNIEIIVVDDASTDNTEQICQNMQGIRYFRIEPEDSAGSNKARNEGIKLAQGEYIALLDDDDEWLPTKVEKQVLFMQKNPDYGAVYCDMRVRTGLAIFDYNVHFFAEGDLVDSKLYYKPFFLTSALMVRKDVLVQVGCFDENIKYWQEYELGLRLLQVCKIGLAHEILLFYRNNVFDRHAMTKKTEGWLEAVSLIEVKHKTTITGLGYEGLKKYKEYFLAEAGHRFGDNGEIDKMKKFYQEAYQLTGKIEYWIRWKFGITRRQTLLLEFLIKKYRGIRNK